jgi:hypothetical protein
MEPHGERGKIGSMGGQTQGKNQEDPKSNEREFEIFFQKEINHRHNDPSIGSKNEHGDAQSHDPERFSLRIPSTQEIVEEIEEILFLEEHDPFFGDGQIPKLDIEEKNSGCHENQTGHDSGGEQVTDGPLQFRLA